MILPLDLRGVPIGDLLAVAWLLDGPRGTQQAPTLARLLAEGLAGEVALRRDAVESGIVAEVRGLVLPPDLAPHELDALEGLLWRWAAELREAGSDPGRLELVERLHLALLRARGAHMVRASQLQRVLGADGP